MPSKSKVTVKVEIRKKEPDACKVPNNWPEDIEFLRDQTYSAAVTNDHRIGLSRGTADTSSLEKIAADTIKAPSQLVEIQTIQDEKHPAYRQRGLFASQDLGPDSFVCLYLGHVHTNSLSDTDPRSDYDLSYDRELDLSVDATTSGNESRFINDYRGIAERPNAEFRDCFVQVKSQLRADGFKWERRVGIFVLSAGKAGKRQGGIKQGKEILVSYGKGFWESRQILAKFRKDFEMRTFDESDDAIQKSTDSKSFQSG